MTTYDDFISIFLQIKSRQEMENFLDGLLTPKEKIELMRRIDIVKSLKKGIPQQEIAKSLGVGVSTVTRGSREIQLGRFRSI